MTSLNISLINIIQDLMTFLVDFQVIYKQTNCPFDLSFYWLAHSVAICLLE